MLPPIDACAQPTYEQQSTCLQMYIADLLYSRGDFWTEAGPILLVVAVALLAVGMGKWRK